MSASSYLTKPLLAAWNIRSKHVTGRKLSSSQDFRRIKWSSLLTTGRKPGKFCINRSWHKLSLLVRDIGPCAIHRNDQGIFNLGDTLFIWCLIGFSSHLWGSYFSHDAVRKAVGVEETRVKRIINSFLPHPAVFISRLFQPFAHHDWSLWPQNKCESGLTNRRIFKDSAGSASPFPLNSPFEFLSSPGMKYLRAQPQLKQ